MSAANRFVVCGPPASGKTTWVSLRRQPGDVVWDFDDVVAVMTGQPLRVRAPEVIDLFERIRVTAACR
jgi:hypothetical protein